MAATELETSWQTALAIAARDCDVLLFATGVLGFKLPGQPNQDREPMLEPWQVQALKTFSRQWRDRLIKKPRLSIRSGHGIGKTAYLSIVILFVLITSGDDVKIPVVANSQDQLRDGLWPELAKWRARLPAELQEWVTWEKERVYISHLGEGAFAVRRTATKHRPEALQGMHAKTILVVLEEASGIPEETIEAGAGTLSTPGAAVIAVGNPTRASGYFYKIHNTPAMRAIWDTMCVSSEDVPRARGHIDDIISTYGKKSNAFRVRVLGEFPTHDDDTVIPLEDVRAARGRNVKVSHVYPVWGVDVGRHGDDASVLAKRQGNTLIDIPRVWRNMDGQQVAGRIIAEYNATPKDDRPRRICVDIIGVGTSVFDFLRRDGSPVRNITLGVNVAEASAVSDIDRKLRDELWFRGRDWFVSRDCCIPKDLAKGDHKQEAILEQLIGELTSATFDFDENGKRVVERKKDMKKRLGHSPDLADALLLTFAGGVFPREVSDDHRRFYEREDEYEGADSAWSA